MTVDEFMKEHAESLAKEAQARKEREKAYIEAKCKELSCSRLARCQDCGKVAASNPKLPYFEERLEKDYDSYYCGCCGWN